MARYPSAPDSLCVASFRRNKSNTVLYTFHHHSSHKHPTSCYDFFAFGRSPTALPNKACMNPTVLVGMIYRRQSLGGLFLTKFS